MKYHAILLPNRFGDCTIRDLNRKPAERVLVTGNESKSLNSVLVSVECFTNSDCKSLLLKSHVKSSMISVLFELPVDGKTKYVWQQL